MIKTDPLRHLVTTVYLASTTIITVLVFTAFSHWKIQEEVMKGSLIDMPSYMWCGTCADMYKADLDIGKSLFVNNCAACHNKDMKSDLTGPALGGVTNRWQKYPKEDLYRFIRESQIMIREGHPRAVELWNTWKPTVMNNFGNLSDGDIEELLKYIEY